MIKKKHPVNKPIKNEKIVKSLVSSVAAIHRLRFLGSVFLSLREDLKEKSG